MRKSLIALSALLCVVAMTVGCRNKPPTIPVKPSGPDSLPVDSVGTFTTQSTDPNRDQILYIFDWDDGDLDTTVFYPSGTNVSKGHSWTTAGTVAIKVKAKDAKGRFSADWSDTHQVCIYSSGINRPPNKPATPTGPDTGWVGQYQRFTSSAVDPDGDSVYIRFIWGEDGRVSYWKGPVPSGTQVTDSVIYFYRGDKYVRAVAMDVDSLLSDTSDAKHFYANQTNTPPSKPILFGPSRGIKDGPYYRFSATSTDPQGDNVQYKFFWGDGRVSDWSSLGPHSVPVRDSVRYSALGSYTIRALCRDQYGGLSDTSDPLTFEVVGEGRVLWAISFGDEVVSSPALGTILNSRSESRLGVVIGITNGIVAGIDAWQGEVVYEASETGVEPFYGSAAIGSDGRAYIGNDNGKLYCLDNSGEIVWTHPDTITGDNMGATPALSGSRIFTGGENRYVQELDAAGNVVWERALTEEMLASPVVDGNGNLIICDDSGYVTSFAPDHSVNWTYATRQNITSSPAVGADGTVYFGTEQGRVYAINSAGQRAWYSDIEPPTSITSSPVIGPDGSIYFGADNGNLYRLDSNGQAVPGWPVALSLSDIPATPALCADGYIYVTAENDTLYAVRDNGTVAWTTELRIPGKTGRGSRHGALGVEDLLPSPVIDQYGIIYIASGFDGVFAIAGRPSGTLAQSAWPMFHHDVKHTGKYGSW